MTDKDAVMAEVEKSQRNRVVKGTTTNYANNQTRFIQWCSVNCATALNRAWVSAIHQEVCQRPLGDDEPIPKLEKGFRKAIRVRLENYNKQLPPLDFANFQVNDGMIYLQQLDILASSKGVHRAAIRALFTDYGVHAPTEWDDNLSILFAGIKRREAEKRQGGELERTDGTKHKKGGKKPMTMHMYRALNSCMYRREQTPFKVLFVLLCWNLMARACNVGNIGLQHMSWHDDALTVEFCHVKTNRTGSGKGLHPRHIYANPKEPQICPILALGVYLLITPRGGAMLFQSTREYDRVLKGLRDTIAESAAELEDLLGISVTEWGLHSLRKGSGSYATNGPCAVNKSVSDNRGGWAQSGQGDVYYGYCPEGDQLIGRVLAGLPMGSSDFAVLPPRFRTGVLDKTVRDAISTLFPSYCEVSNAFPRVLSFCLASVVFHSDWLLKTIPHNHPLRSCALFTDPALLASLKALVVCEIAQPGAEFQATGVPETIIRLVEQQRQSEQLKMLAVEVHQNAVEISQSSKSVVSAVCSKIDEMGVHILKELDERQVESHLTPHGMRSVASEVVTGLLDEKSLSHLPRQIEELKALISNFHTPPDVAAAPVIEVERRPANSPNDGFRTYVWGGKIRALPETFMLPTARHPPSLIWNLYICGKPEDGIPPLRLVEAWNCPPSCYRRYCEFLQLMKMIRQVVEEQNAWSDDATAENAVRMFQIGKSCLNGAMTGARQTEKAWTTIFKDINAGRRNKKRTRSKSHSRDPKDAEDEAPEDVGEERSNDELDSFVEDVPMRKR